MRNEVKEAVQTLTKALSEDKELFYAWQANIAMQFKDEYNSEKDKGHINNHDIHRIANNAAIKFINLLIEQKNER